MHSPSISKLELLQRGRVRRAKLYYLRDLRGKKARIKERRVDDAKLAAMEAAAAEAAAAADVEAAEVAADVDDEQQVEANASVDTTEEAADTSEGDEDAPEETDVTPAAEGAEVLATEEPAEG